MSISYYKVTIRETRDGWIIYGPNIRFSKCKTAANALKAIKRRSKKLGDLGISNAFHIIWEPITKVGKLVVDSIVSE